MPRHYQRRRWRSQQNNPTHTNNPGRPQTYQHNRRAWRLRTHQHNSQTWRPQTYQQNSQTWRPQTYQPNSQTWRPQTYQHSPQARGPQTFQHSPQNYQIINPYPIMVLYPGTYMYAWPPHGVTTYLTLMPPPLYWYPYNPHPPIEEYQMNPNWALTMSTPNSQSSLAPNSQSSLEAPQGRLSAPLPEDLYPTQEELRSYWTVNTEYQGMEEQPMNMEVPTTTSEESRSPP